MKLVAAIAVAALLQTAGVPVRVIDQGSQSGIEEARRVVVTTPEQFAGLWREHSTHPQPAVDFSRESVVGLFLGTRQTAGYAVEIVSVSQGGTGTVVSYRERTPSPGSITAQVLTFPFVIAAVPVLVPPVRFESVR